MVGSGCLYASLDDFYYWDQALEHDRLVSAAAKAAAYTPARLNDGSSTGYGFGWRIAEHLGRRQVSHGGSWVGFRTHISRYPDDHVTIVVLSNLGQFDAGGCGRKIAAIVFAEPKTKDL
jgi:CubicO group peptidase (beta-lactamase class C family)